MSDAIVLQEVQPLTAVEMRAQVNRIQEVMKSVMQKGQHYGTVPGCGDKPTLLKPGAEKLMMTFRLAADPQVQEIPTDDGITFRVTCRILSQATGVFLGAGVGECSSKEDKYNWRASVSDKEWTAVGEDRKRIKYTRNGEIKQVRTNPADVANTVLKMAKKRALVDGILTVTGASDIFTQDIEDMPEEVVGTKGTPASAATKTSTVQPSSAHNTNGGAVITEKQGKLVYARLKSKGLSDTDLKTFFGLAHLKDIPASKLNNVLAWIDNPLKPHETPAGEPTNCTHDAISCEVVMWDVAGKPLCNGKPCPYYKEPESF
ncbi:MAG: hypothetical protein HY954_04505 [Deltaproteobacteria bacterium]|nr:hypothetical protein [Deltaproteobacteria bacterium]